jgi:hypothetical membrane protein
MDKLTGLAWAALLIAMIGDILTSVTLPALYKGYDIKKDSISALGNPESPVRKVFNLWMLIEGLLFLLALPAIFGYYRNISLGLTITTVIFIAVFAVGACILTCFFSVNKDKDVVTTASKIHGAGSVTGFMLFLFVPLLVAILSFKGQDKATGIISVISFIIALVFFALFVMSDKPEFKKTFVNNEGLWQRLNLVFMYLPLAVVAVKNIAGLIK